MLAQKHLQKHFPCVYVFVCFIACSCVQAFSGESCCKGLQRMFHDRIWSKALTGAQKRCSIHSRSSNICCTSTFGDSSYVFDFGKFRGTPVSNVPQWYLEWIVRENVYVGRPRLAKALQMMNLLKAKNQYDSQPLILNKTIQHVDIPSHIGAASSVSYTNLALKSADELVLSFDHKSIQNRPLLQDLNAIPSSRHCISTGSWTFGLQFYGKVVKALEKNGISYESVPKSVVRMILDSNASSKGKERSFDMVATSHVGAALMPFQRDGVQFVLQRGGRALIGDEMGLGKTLQALAAALAYRDNWPLLVLAPSSLRFHWEHELREWIPDESDIRVVSSGTDLDSLGGRIVVASYDMVPRLKEVMKEANFGVIIADEAHYLKDLDSLRTRAVVPLLQTAQRVILLTGTPALARPAELQALLKALLPRLFPSRKEYERRYCDARETPWGRDTRGASNLGELGIVLSHLVMVRRLKADVLSQMPPKLRRRIFISLPPSNLAKLKAIWAKNTYLQQMIASNTGGWGEDGGGLDQRSALFEMYKETGLAKAEAAADYVVELVERGAKVLVFAHHTAVLDTLEQAVRTRLGGHGRDVHIRIDGSVLPEARAALVEHFQRDNTVRVALLSVTTSAIGLTLTAATTVVFAELHWTPGLMNQAEGRAHRIGQTGTVNVVYLHAPGTLDDVIWQALAGKASVVSNLLEEANRMGRVPKPIAGTDRADSG